MSREAHVRFWEGAGVQLPRATHLPLERQVRIMRREGLDTDSHTLWDQLNALAQVLEPSHAALTRYVLSAELLGADETWRRVMVQPKAKRWWAWTLAREDAVVYRILDSRSQEAARQVLGEYRGVVMADGYGAYDVLARGSPGFTLAHCWAHVRRKFVEAEPHYPAPCQTALGLIGRLYAVEAQVPALRAEMAAEDRAEALAVRARVRAEQSRGIVREMRDWALGQRVLPESSLGKAIAYLQGLWTGLTRFLDDPGSRSITTTPSGASEEWSWAARTTTAPAPSGGPRSRPSSTA
jgi:transposase